MMSDPKKQLRERFGKLRVEFTLSDRDLKQHNHFKALSTLLNNESTFYWGAYKSVGSEANPEFVINEFTNIKWAYPCIKDDQLVFYKPEGPGFFEPGLGGILEPIPALSMIVYARQLTGLLIPGLAFDRQGHRLGSGHGYYDRFLKDYNGVKIGFAYSIQISESELPFESHDQKMDYVATEKELISCLKC